MSKNIGYEKNLKTYMIISGYGMLLIFGGDQAVVQTLAPYPPFGLVTTTVLIAGAFLMLLGIYNSVTLVSMNNTLCASIQKQALRSKLLSSIGRAEMENEIQKTVERINQERDELEMECTSTTC
jgi:high-affinity nickel permease